MTSMLVSVHRLSLSLYTLSQIYEFHIHTNICWCYIHLYTISREEFVRCYFFYFLLCVFFAQYSLILLNAKKSFFFCHFVTHLCVSIFFEQILVFFRAFVNTCYKFNHRIACTQTVWNLNLRLGRVCSKNNHGKKALLMRHLHSMRHFKRTQEFCWHHCAIVCCKCQGVTIEYCSHQNITVKVQRHRKLKSMN